MNPGVNYHDVEQRSEEWFQLRCGLITGSNINNVLREDKKAVTRQNYLNTLVGQRYSGIVEQTYQNQYMKDGADAETIIVELFTERTGFKVDHTGFVTNDEHEGMGCSPDGLLENGCGIIECKKRLMHIQVALLNDDSFIPNDALYQMMYNMMICNADYCYYISYCHGLPLYVNKIGWRPALGSKIVSSCKEFNTEIEAKLEKIRRL